MRRSDFQPQLAKALTATLDKELGGIQTRYANIHSNYLISVARLPFKLGLQLPIKQHCQLYMHGVAHKASPKAVEKLGL